MFPNIQIPVSGERFLAEYQVAGSRPRETAREICLEQTVELPDALVPPDLDKQIVGRIEDFKPLDGEEAAFRVRVSYAVESSGFELPQLLNVLFGNTSMKAGVRLLSFDLPAGLLQHFTGPKFGTGGLRQRLGVPHGAILGTAIKPQGFPAYLLAENAYRFALGGIDIIKDDHGLADQSFAPFRERVLRCAEAVARANRQSGRRSIYVANITGPSDQILEKALFAVQAGAGGLEIAPGLAGWDSLRQLSQSEQVSVPLLFHPALLGTYTLDRQSGIALAALFGQLPRLAGADGVIYTNYGGRFSTTQADCLALKQAVRQPMGLIQPILPMPGGGMSLERIPEMLSFYGEDVVLLVSGGLYGQGPDLEQNSRQFRHAVDRLAA